MKATIEFPDDLYRRVKAKSAMERRTVREVAETLFQRWLTEPERAEASYTDALQEPPSTAPAWYAGAADYAREVNRHDMASVRRSIARGRAAAGGARAESRGT